MPPDPGLRAAHDYNTKRYRQSTIMRPFYMLYFLNRGYNILWQDIDSIPVADPLAFLPPALPPMDVVLT